jgi:hypothetical protein
MRISNKLNLLLASAALVAMAGAANAAVDTFDSSTATQNNTGGSTVLATVDGSWATALAGSSWITAAGDTDPAIGTSVLYTVTFTLPTGFSDAVLNLGVFADDSATVLIDGTTLFTENTTLGSHCASGAIGCTSGTEGILSGTNVTADLHAGTNTITFRDFQEVDGTPFGVDFAGSVSYQAGNGNPNGSVPEPSTIALFGAGLLAFATFMGVRRRKVMAQ